MSKRFGSGAAAALIGALLWGGCSGGRRVDALRDIGVDANAPTRGLSVVLVNSANTKNTMAYAAAWRAGAGGYDNNAIIKNLPGLFGRHFKSVVSTGTFEAAQALKPDLIALIDAYGHHSGFGVGKTELEMKIVFLTPERREVESLSSHRKASIGILGLTPVGPWIWGNAIRSIQDLAEGDIEAALAASAKLADFAAGRSPGAAPAPAQTWHSEVDAAAYREAEKPNYFALVIGIEKYAAMPEARFAERDARAVKEHLLALGFPPRNIRLLTGADATRASLSKNLQSWLPSATDADSTVFFYYSGHGAPDLQSGRAYLVPWDGDAAFLKDTALPVASVYEALNALKARKVLVALDSCFSGRGARSLLAKGARPLVTKLDTAAGLVGKLLVMTASADDQIAGSEETQGHGIFTYYFLKGLSGAAADEKGGVTVKSLYSYLVPRVRDSAGRENRDQVPQLLPSAAAPAAELRLK